MMVRATAEPEEISLTGYYKEKNAGELYVRVEYLRDGEAQEDDF